jgi:hypothetical protein
MPSTKVSLRFGLLAAACWLATIGGGLAQVPAEITFSLSRADIAVLATALDAIPYSEAGDLRGKLQSQIDAQTERWDDLHSATVGCELPCKPGSWLAPKRVR